MQQEITTRQKRAVFCLITTGDARVAANAAHVTEKTVHRWLDNKDFQAYMVRARVDCVSQTTGRLQQASIDAAEQLANIIQDSRATATARVSAIRIALDYSYKGLEIDQLLTRLSALEERSKSTNDYPPIH